MAKGITLQEMSPATSALVKIGLFGVATNSGNDYSVTVSAAVKELEAGLPIRFKVVADSTGAPTFNFNGTGAHPVLKPGGSEASFKEDGIYTVVWDGDSAFILQGERGEDEKYFGDGSDGILNTTDNVTLTVETQDVTTIVKQYQSIHINVGHILSIDKRCRGVILYCQGDLTIDGTIDVSGKSAFVNPNTVDQVIIPIAVKKLMWYDPVNNLSFGVPKGGVGGTGGDGGPAYTTTSVGKGGVGGGGNWFGGGQGGGGAGGSASITNGAGTSATLSVGGDGGNGSSGPGGAAGAGAYTTINITTKAGVVGGVGAGGGGASGMRNSSTAFTARAGNGGSGVNGGGASGGGAAATTGDASAVTAANGVDGTNVGGGMILIIVRGNISISSTGKILSNAINNGQKGVAGTSVNNGSTYQHAGGGGGGGGAGGGVISLLYGGSFSNAGTLQVKGTTGGAGGSGTNGTAFAGSSGGVGSILTKNIS